MRFILLLALSLLSACGAKTIDLARETSEAGRAASAALLAEAETTSAAFARSGEYRRLRNILLQVPQDRAAEAEIGGLETDILGLLAQREQLFRELSKSYASLSDLASVDARAETTEALNGLTGSYANLAAAAAFLPGLPQSVAALASRVGGLAAQARQGRYLREANEIFLQVLPEVQKIVRSEEAYALSILDVALDDRRKLERVLLGIPLADVTPRLAELTSRVDLPPLDGARDVAARNAGVAGALDDMARVANERAKDDFARQYRALDDQLTRLIAAHRRIREDTAPSFALVLAEAEALLKAVEAVRKELSLDDAVPAVAAAAEAA